MRKSQAGNREQSCSAKMKRGGSRRTSPSCLNCCGKNERAAFRDHYGGLYAALQNRESQNTGALRMAALGVLAGDGLAICQAITAEIMTASANFILQPR